MEILYTRKLLFTVKISKGPPVHINDLVLNLCKKTIIFFSRVCQFLVPYYIHDDVIKHQTNLHDTSMIIIIYILPFNGYIIGQDVK